MTEAEWFACMNPDTMFQLFHASPLWRKLYLSACACIHHIWELIPEGPCRSAFEVAQRHADGFTNSQEVSEAYDWASNALEEVYRRCENAANPIHFRTLAEFYSIRAVFGFFRWMNHEAVGLDVASYAREAPARVVWRSLAREDEPEALARAKQALEAAKQQEANWQSDMIRDIFGNPFHPPYASASSWLAWNDGTVVRIAQAIYDERAFDRMPILADALEDAGCDNADILRHCREPGEHVRGCWVVDLLLGKT
jgi:hypothetical protein